MAVHQNCNLELRLSPGDDHHHRHQPRLHHFLGDESIKQQMTIFYNGRVCVADFTQDQATAIIKLATRQREEKLEPSWSQEQCSGLSLNRSSDLSSSSSLPEQCSGGGGSGLSMKRSLQRFLQKRKNRIQSALPYHH